MTVTKMLFMHVQIDTRLQWKPCHVEESKKVNDHMSDEQGICVCLMLMLC